MPKKDKIVVQRRKKDQQPMSDKQVERLVEAARRALAKRKKKE